MNAETKQKITDNRFQALFQTLNARHNPITARLEPARLECIGLIIVKFQRLESSLLKFIKLLADIEAAEAQILTVKHSFKNVLSTLAALAFHKQIADLEDVQFLVKKAEDAEDIRNQLVHSLWSSGPRFKTDLHKKKGLVTKVEDYTVADLGAIATWVDQLDTSFDALAYRYIDQCHAQGIPLKNVIKVAGRGNLS
jgi:hypothetical protein